jgi:hypothetical protein
MIYIEECARKFDLRLLAQNAYLHSSSIDDHHWAGKRDTGPDSCCTSASDLSHQFHRPPQHQKMMSFLDHFGPDLLAKDYIWPHHL